MKAFVNMKEKKPSTTVNNSAFRRSSSETAVYLDKMMNIPYI